MAAEILSMALFWDIALIVIAAALMSALLKALKQPSLFAYIVAGIIVGPLVLGSVDFNALGMPFKTIGIHAMTPETTLLSELGVAFLLFSVGVETSIKKLFSLGKDVLIGTIAQVAAIIGAIFLLTVPLGLLSAEQAIFVGTILAFSSTMIVVKILSDKKEINTLKGRIMIAVLLIQDFLVVLLLPLLANISSFGEPSILINILSKSVLLILSAIVLNKIVFPPLFKKAAEEQELLFLSGIATAFFFIGLSVILEMPIAIGGFIGGIALSTLPYNIEIFSKMRALRDFFVTIFFVTLGIQLNFHFGTLNPLLMLIILLTIFAIKPLVLFILTLLSGYGTKISTETGMMLGQVSEFGFVLAGIGLTTVGMNGEPIFSHELFSFIIAVVALSMIITPYIANSSSRLSAFVHSHAKKVPNHKKFSKLKKYFNRQIDSLEKLPNKWELKNHIIIVGSGMTGGTLAKALHPYKQVLVLDSNPETVRNGIREGMNYAYGDPDNDEMLEKIDIKDAKLLVLAIPTHEKEVRFMEEAKKANKKIVVFATAHHFYEALDLYKKGADLVLMPYIMGSNAFLENVSKYMETGKIEQTRGIMDEYMRYLEEKAEEERKTGQMH
ncbi:MAG: cation:proton antiporter [Candidatus Diapherotrites archaeon]|nr:cation:proton antiporter [Candidatus Diapherotrites archaeon]